MRDATNPAAGVVPFHRRYYSVPSITTFDLHARDNAVYIQDSWRPSTRLTVNAGIRLDWIMSRDALFDLETLNDFAIGPRLGVNYALTSDSKNLLRASYGRVGDVPNANYLGSAGTAVAGIRDEYDTYPRGNSSPARRREFLIESHRPREPGRTQPRNRPRDPWRARGPWSPSVSLRIHCRRTLPRPARNRRAGSTEVI